MSSSRCLFNYSAARWSSSNLLGCLRNSIILSTNTMGVSSTTVLLLVLTRCTTTGTPPSDCSSVSAHLEACLYCTGVIGSGGQLVGRLGLLSLSLLQLSASTCVIEPIRLWHILKCLTALSCLLVTYWQSVE